MTGQPGGLSPREEAIIDRFSGTEPLPAGEVEQIVEAGRLAARGARMPDGIPHLDEIIAAFPKHHRTPIMVGAFIENATIDHPTLACEVGVREWLLDGGAVEPVIEVAREADRWGM
ncbi:hypothetical protein [Aeromicrobium ginsengisoli]|uniref:Uncharacterized protein n=1 Tax=Aeromicrobium ginsengisoli TaxID=363867 RepID=A0A5M4FI69_9ACTN|nr:hypothetical protein [Aeromicrobium ginsengisoli]KAA1399658.1 hypothetical protein ESP70_002535 [Aeromicrobium ginsengisoli]